MFYQPIEEISARIVICWLKLNCILDGPKCEFWFEIRRHIKIFYFVMSFKTSVICYSVKLPMVKFVKVDFRIRSSFIAWWEFKIILYKLVVLVFTVCLWFFGHFINFIVFSVFLLDITSLSWILYHFILLLFFATSIFVWILWKMMAA